MDKEADNCYPFEVTFLQMILIEIDPGEMPLLKPDNSVHSVIFFQRIFNKSWSGFTM